MRSLMILCIFALTGCGSSREAVQRADAGPNPASECITREALEIAPMNVDLETAAAGVIARCYQYTDATRRDLVARYPGYRGYIGQKTRELDDIYLQQARMAVAAARTSR